MRRTIKRQAKEERVPDAILFADAHLRQTIPLNRKDDFLQSMWRKIDFISALQEKYDCPVLHAGDLFNHWKTSPFLMTLAIQRMPKKFYSVVGNHDLPQNNMEFIEKAGIRTLAVAGVVTLLESGNWNQNEFDQRAFFKIKNRTILVWHKFVYKKKEHWKSDIGGETAGGVLRKVTNHFDVDLILTGDNHEAFVETHKGSILVNPGSMMRITTKQIDFKPRVYLWYADTNTVEPVYLPIEDNVFDMERVVEKEQRDDRMNAFVKSLDTDWEGGSTIENNFEIFFRANKTEQEIQTLVLKAIEYNYE
jgi:putative phosphoesterase